MQASGRDLLFASTAPRASRGRPAKLAAARWFPLRNAKAGPRGFSPLFMQSASDLLHASLYAARASCGSP